MKVKPVVAILFAITIIAVSFVILKVRNEKLATEKYLEWFNGWASDLVKIRTISHDKTNLIAIPELKDEDLTNSAKLKEFIDGLEQTKQSELWKIDTVIIISDYWYNKIDLMLTRKLSKEQIVFVKSYLIDGEKRGIDFRQLTVTYFDDYLTLLNFMYDAVNNFEASGRKMDKNDLIKLNNLQTIFNQSQGNYTKKLDDINNYNIKKVEEFNNQFKNANLTKLLDLIKGI